MEGLYPIVRRRRRPLVQVADAVEAAGLMAPAAAAAPLSSPATAENVDDMNQDENRFNSEEPEAETLY